MKRAIAWAAAVGVLAAAGCASVFDFRRQELLESSVKRYADFIRWSDFESARAFLAPGAAALPRPRIEGVRVTDYRVRSRILGPDARRAEQVVEIDYHRLDDPRIRSVEDRQVWEFEPQRGLWLLASGLPAF